ncbi:Taf8p [Kluyveromyces lactis]|uniref:Transcription initiation factor TFIID subunit 8 n=1 Tax=Kluyveromyces lactis (strain ATCC 8585 / CBS 2359 / DSM 70799 / NBRC 1267 / NRRL Y-1140 / WM37) TaxID=284590 RepID=Q6CSE8_KLULA|nr:uncharacterized protein KLLA0_D01617g [Kluyveromyces lactis]CAH00237.1 KLLA0D01617p [Kluyveromyces lactis]|eukprot:XP_453141.1 uncharacterized protein KLLA0_D01617g [Kluyveromyces lactis]
MTTSEDKDKNDAKIETDQRRVRLDKLPNLNEVPHANPMERLFAQAVLLQLKTLNKNVVISQLAFDDLCYVSLLQLDDLLQSLKKITQVQRRTKISKLDLNLYFKGIGMDLKDLNGQVEISNFVHGKFKDEANALNETVLKVKQQFMKELEEKELLSSKHSEFFVQDVDILNLLPSSNKSNKYVPSWLPELPPDHTYKFTSLYKRPITDERLMKKKLLEEGRLSEKALLNMLSQVVNQDPLVALNKDSDQSANNAALSEHIKESQLETDLIFDPHKTIPTDKEWGTTTVLHGIESFNLSPVKNFNVLEYCKKRDAIVKRRAERAENQVSNKRRNPFIRGAMICSPYGQGSTKSRKSVENQLKTMLRRSYLGLIDSIPRVKEVRERARKEAEERERLLQEQRRIEKEKKMAEQEILDLNNLQTDPLLHGWDKDSEDDDENDDEKFLTQGPPEVQAITDTNISTLGELASELLHGPDEEKPMESTETFEDVLPSITPANSTPLLSEVASGSASGLTPKDISEDAPEAGSEEAKSELALHTSPGVATDELLENQSQDHDSNVNDLF